MCTESAGMGTISFRSPQTQTWRRCERLFLNGFARTRAVAASWTTPEKATCRTWNSWAPRNLRALLFAAQEVFWQLVIEGDSCPRYGFIQSQPALVPCNQVPGKRRYSVRPVPAPRSNRVPEAPQRKDPKSRPDSHRVSGREPPRLFRRGNRVASTRNAYGIATAERVFLLLCDSLYVGTHRRPKRAQGVQRKSWSWKFPVKPKLDWVHQKIQLIPKAHSNFPDNT